MAKSRALEDTLVALQRLREDPSAAASISALRRALGGKSSHVAAKAAQISGEFELGELVPDLVAAFERFLINPAKADPGCTAKAAIADALYRIGADAEGVFLSGIHHRQPEPVWGGRADTAGGLRGVCALGLVRMNHRDAMLELADLLADPDPQVRADAARAIAYSENDNGVPLLRLKVRVGDSEMDVISECLSALLRLAPSTSVSFVADFLDAPDITMQETAALALGGSRLAAAFSPLRQWWDRMPNPALRRTALLAISMLKRDDAIDFLLSIIAQATGPTARDAIAALRLYRHDDGLVQRVREVATQRTDLDLRKTLAETFD